MSPFLPVDPALERRIREAGHQLLARLDASPAPGIFSKKGVVARLMKWSLKDPAFKSQLVRFVVTGVGSGAVGHDLVYDDRALDNDRIATNRSIILKALMTGLEGAGLELVRASDTPPPLAPF